jgi:hypothetical protein
MGTLYSRELHTYRTVSGGYQVDDSVYFLVDYGLYRAPRGIARFPDGGRARYILRNVYLFRADFADPADPPDGAASSVTNVAQLVTGDVHGRNVKNSYFEEDGNQLSILFQSTHESRDGPGGWQAVELDLSSSAVTPIGTSRTAELLQRMNYDGEQRVGISETTALLDQATLKELGLPSPPDHMDRSDRHYRDDLVELRVDQNYRRAIVEAIADGTINADPERILRRMDEKKNSLDEPYRGLYEMRAADVREPLEALLE